MNLFNSDKIVPEKVENLIIPRKDFTKVFQISKIEKIRAQKIIFSKSKTEFISNGNNLIKHEINLSFKKIQSNSMNEFGNKNSPFQLKKKTPEKKSNDFLEENEKFHKRKKFVKMSYIKERKIRKSNSLIKPVLVEDDNQLEKIKKNNEKTEKSLKINIQNNFKYNTVFNNFIFNDFGKILKFNNNNNFIFPFNFNSNNFLKEKPLFEFKPFSFKKDFFKDNSLKFQFNTNNKIVNTYQEIKNENINKKEKLNISLFNSTNQDTSFKKKIIFQNEKVYKKKGRKAKNLKDINIQSKHTKFSPDNMMRKIKNKIIESSRLLTNKILSDEISKIKDKFRFPYMEFKKIKGSFSQELNIKFNLWFYQIKIKDIFSMELSAKYSSLEKYSNKELIEYIFSNDNINYFEKSKSLLNMPFHQYFHDIFLEENKSWLLYFGITPENNKYDINYLLNSLKEEDENSNMNKLYIEKIERLAHNYEDFFLYKKMRSVGLSDRRSEFVKSFMSKTFKVDYTKYFEQVEQIKNYYNNRKKGLEQNNIKFSNDSNEKKEKQNDDILNDIIINISNENNNNNQFLKRKRNLEVSDKKNNALIDDVKNFNCLISV